MSETVDGQGVGAICAGCDQPLPAPVPGARRGRPREFHSSACRMRALRRRKAPNPEDLRSELRTALPDLQLPPRSADTVDYIADESVPEVARRVEAVRTAIDRLTEILPTVFSLDDQVQETTTAPAPAVQDREVAGMKPTAEQGAIIDACASGIDLVVEAGAGTGKTTTLRMASTQMKGRGLYVAYNRAIAQDAKKVFPAGVQCATAHSLAYRAHGHTYKHRLNARVPASRTAELLRIVEPIRVNADTVLTPYALARLAADTVDAYAYSADEDVQARHVPALEGVDHPDMSALRREILPYARQLWRDTQDPQSQHRYTHDYYLKAWALTQPQLPADYVLLDEAQDSNPVVAHLVQAQTAQRIAVGDSAQAIYGWRGAVDALATWPAQKRLYLQQSWRFGPAIADEANLWLTHIGAPIRLQGNPSMQSRVLPGSCRDTADAVLCRTNAETIARAMALLARGRRPALVGGAGQIKALAEAALQLQAGRPASHPELLAFTSWEQLKTYVRDEASGSDLRTFVRLIDDYGPERVISAANALVSENRADVILSTAHRAKGREWPTVLIADDFTEPKRQDDGTPGPIRKDEARLAYVAVTRARKALDNQGLTWINNYTQPSRNGA